MIIRIIITLLCNACMLILYNNVASCFLEYPRNRKVLHIVLCMIWLIFTTLCGFNTRWPLVNFLVNTGLLFLIVSVYYGHMSTKIVMTVMLTALAAACDFFSYIVVTEGMNKPDDYSVGYIYTVLLFWISSKVILFLYSKKREFSMNSKSPVMLLFIPLFSAALLYSITYGNLEAKYMPLTGISILGICFVTFYFEYIELRNIENKANNENLIRQIKSYKHELNTIENSQQRIQGLRHDLKHHLIAIESMARECDMEGIINYTHSMQSEITSGKEIFTGRYEVDSLLNYLLEDAYRKLSNVNVKIAIPNDIKLDKYDFNVIIGNLLENAIFASEKSKEKLLDIRIATEKGALLIKITNSYEGEIVIADGIIRSSKTDKANHGFGINNVRRIVEKQEGEFSAIVENGYFIVNIFLYL